MSSEILRRRSSNPSIHALPAAFIDDPGSNAPPLPRHFFIGIVAGRGKLLALASRRCIPARPLHAAGYRGTACRAALRIWWRRRRDSNPRNGSPFTPLAGARLRPLGHLSKGVGNELAGVIQGLSTANGQAPPLSRSSAPCRSQDCSGPVRPALPRCIALPGPRRFRRSAMRPSAPAFAACSSRTGNAGSAGRGWEAGRGGARARAQRRQPLIL